MMPRAKLAQLLLALTAAILLAASPAFATCSSPPGNEGDVQYSGIQHIMSYCNGTVWISMGSNAAITFGTLTSPDFCTATGSTAIQCTTASTGSGNVMLATSPTMTSPTVSSGGLTITAGGLTVSAGGASITGTVSGTTFSGSGSGLTGIGTSNFSATGGTSTNFYRGDGTWAVPSIGTSSLTGVVGIANGGTATSTQTTNGVNYYNGTAITSGTGFVYSGGQVGIGTTSSADKLDVEGGLIAVGIGSSTNSLLGAGTLLFAGYPTGITFGNAQTINDNGGGGLKINIPNATSMINLATNGGYITLMGGYVGIGTTSPT